MMKVPWEDDTEIDFEDPNSSFNDYSIGTRMSGTRKSVWYYETHRAPIISIRISGMNLQGDQPEKSLDDSDHNSSTKKLVNFLWKGFKKELKATIFM